MRWQLQEAKAKLSELVKRAEAEGPQAITVHGKIRAVLVSQAEFERLTRPKLTLLEAMLRAPSDLTKLDLERDPDATERPVGL